jgi:hypothetical protein
MCVTTTGSLTLLGGIGDNTGLIEEILLDGAAPLLKGEDIVLVCTNT